MKTQINFSNFKRGLFFIAICLLSMSISAQNTVSGTSKKSDDALSSLKINSNANVVNIHSLNILEDLPMEISVFYSNCNPDNTITVSWNTTSEPTGIYYLLYKSSDLASWTMIDTIHSVDCGTNPHLYSYSDMEINTSETYYTLVANLYGDPNMLKYPMTLGLIMNPLCENALRVQLSVSPNPVNDIATVNISNCKENADAVLTLFNEFGFPVMSTTNAIGENTYSFNLSGLPVGRYVINAVIDRKVSSSSILIKL
ncbi:MAG: T9SS type A sorting domain-containing protein [Bacteroidota bacterium]